MTNLQRIQLRRSEVRGRLNELSGVEAPTTEQDAELATLETEYGALEIRERAAIIAEDATERRRLLPREAARARNLPSLKRARRSETT